MPILDKKTLQAARAVTLGTLDDTATIYSPTGVDNGLGQATTYGLRDVQPCRATSVSDEDVSDDFRQLNKQLYRVTMGAGATIALNEKVTISGALNVTGMVVEDLANQTNDVVATMFMLAVGL